MNQELHNFVIHTDQKLDECESPYPFVDKVQHEWTMWIDEADFQSRRQSRLQLIPVLTEHDYEQMFQLRKKIEVAFGYQDEKIVRSFVKDIRLMAETYGGHWFLAKFENQFIGQIGIVPFAFRDGRIGRLKDVDILPEYQGKGFGNELLVAACAEAIKLKISALCLTADAQNWPKDWYLKFGFKKVGEVKKS